MTFDPLQQQGIPVAEQFRSWRELNVEPVANEGEHVRWATDTWFELAINDAAHPAATGLMGGRGEGEPHHQSGAAVTLR